NAQLPWLPASLAPATAEGQPAAAAAAVTTTTLANLELGHPIFRFLKGRLKMSLPAIGRYFPAAPRAGAAVLASYSDGKPFLIERAAGRGRVLLMTTPIDTDWNALPLTHLFLPLM